MSPISVTGVGDLISLAHLAWEIVAILYDASATSKDLLSLAGDIAAVPTALDSAVKILSSRADVPSQAVTTITHAFRTCEEILQHLHRYICSNREGNEDRRRVWGSVRAAFSWSAFGGKAEVEGLRIRLGEQLSLINIFLTEFQSETVMEISARTQQQSVVMKRVVDLLTSLPPAVHYDVPFVVFEMGGQGALPLIKLPYLMFLESLLVLTGSNPFLQPRGRNTIHTHRILLDTEIPCGCYFYFEYYTYRDPTNHGEQSVLVSPLHHGVRKGSHQNEQKCFWGIDICGMGSRRRGKVHRETLDSGTVDVDTGVCHHWIVAIDNDYRCDTSPLEFQVVPLYDRRALYLYPKLTIQSIPVDEVEIFTSATSAYESQYLWATVTDVAGSLDRERKAGHAQKLRNDRFPASDRFPANDDINLMSGAISLNFSQKLRLAQMHGNVEKDGQKLSAANHRSKGMVML
ncbi:hypothetical protein EXIGLDRAFT_756187 [Exidia glandulosa HHB12029]|uniref:Fungal N-terminal domain-containing protein n=1 Tax=Exidia glandulosa HHB12029 TaxID=1314781 RepID=A0A165BFE7_EXIGL|nr:hypothetical protein EXIGLDRAFT_756187 [Exidia glandulosa HHB12029]